MNAIGTQQEVNTNQSGLHTWIGNDKTAYNAWKIAADLEDTEAIFNLACCYHQGIGMFQIKTQVHSSLLTRTYVRKGVQKILIELLSCTSEQVKTAT